MTLSTIRGRSISEIDADAKLDEAREVSLRCYLAEIRSIEVRIGAAEHWGVKGIQGLGAELDFKAFVDGEGLE